MADTDGHGGCFTGGNKYTADPKNCFVLEERPTHKDVAEKYRTALEHQDNAKILDEMRAAEKKRIDNEKKQACDEAVRQATWKLQARIEEARHAIETVDKALSKALAIMFALGLGGGVVIGGLITGLVWAIMT